MKGELSEGYISQTRENQNSNTYCWHNKLRQGQIGGHYTQILSMDVNRDDEPLIIGFYRRQDQSSILSLNYFIGGLFWEIDYQNPPWTLIDSKRCQFKLR